MVDLLLLFLIGTGTAFATGLGAIPVFLLGERANAIRPFLWGLAAGLMTVASIVGLLQPAWREGSPLEVILGTTIGVAFLFGSRALLADHHPNFGALRSDNVRRSILVFGVLFAHSLPEGLAVGAAYAAEPGGVGVFVIIAIALQNIPEGTTSAIPMQEAGFSRKQQFWAAVGTSAPQPFGAVGAYLAIEFARSVLPLSLSFAAGAMLTLVAVELVPDSITKTTWKPAFFGAIVGGGIMIVLGQVFAV